MTVEAAIVLPLFLFFFLNLASALEMMRLHGNLELALWNAGRNLTTYGAFLTEPVKGLPKTGHNNAEAVASTAYSGAESSGGDSETAEALFAELGDLTVSYLYVRNSILEYLGEDYLDGSPIRGGRSGLSFLESEILGSGDIVDITVTYGVSPPIEMNGLISFRMANRYYAHLWNGYQVSGDAQSIEEEQIVYVTENSEVYHVTEACTHLRLTIRAISPAELAGARNKGGGKYTPCEVCASGSMPEVLYIGVEGDRYHYTDACYGLNRSYEAVPLSSVQETHRPCSRCGK